MVGRSRTLEESKSHRSRLRQRDANPPSGVVITWTSALNVYLVLKKGPATSPRRVRGGRVAHPMNLETRNAVANITLYSIVKTRKFFARIFPPNVTFSVWDLIPPQ